MLRGISRTLQVIIVDDNSPEYGTGPIAEELRQNDGAIHVLRRPGKMGLGTAYLAGFRQALSLWQWFDSDDGRRFLASSPLSACHNAIGESI